MNLLRYPLTRQADSSAPQMEKHRSSWKIQNSWWARGFTWPKSILVIFMAICLALLFIYFVWSVKRSYVVSALTRGVIITFFDDASNAWRLVDASICSPKSQRPRNLIPDGKDDSCNPDIIDPRLAHTGEIAWPAGTTISIQRMTNGGIQIAVLEIPVTLSFGNTQLAAGSLMFLPQVGFHRSAPLPFVGLLTLGLVARPGRQAELASGHYEVRETLPFREKPERVGFGDFIPGDSVTFVVRCEKQTSIDKLPNDVDPECSRTGQPDESSDLGYAVVQGFVGTPQNAEDEAFRVVAYVPVGETRMRINRRTLDPADIVPSWTDRAINDPWVLGFAAVLGLLGALKGFLLDGMLLLVEPKEARRHPSHLVEARLPGERGGPEMKEGSRAIGDSS